MSHKRFLYKRLPDWVGSVWKKYSCRIYKLCRSKCATKDEADDLFQDVALKFCENASVLNNGSHLYSWLETVLLHCHYSGHRKKGGVHIISLSNLCDTMAVYDETDVKYDIVLDDEMNEDSVMNEFALLLNVLSPLERMIVELSVVGGFNIREISRLIGLSKSNIVNRRVEAFKKMREKMLMQQEHIEKITGQVASLRKIIEGTG